MLSVQENFSLLPYNTFGMDVRASCFTAIRAEEDIAAIYELPDFKKGILVLGGGSNMLLTRDVDRWVIHNELKGIRTVREDERSVWLEVAAGEIWHGFVVYCVSKGWGGVENLSLIPGRVGAAPIQNIGAYGAEVKDTIEEVRFWHLEEKQFYSFKNAACDFGYRESIFKHVLKGKIIITSVTFRLSKQPEFNTSYGNIRQELDIMGVTELSLKHISDAVIRIRSAKLPDPKETGNAGSFFKNPEISAQQYEFLKADHTAVPGYILSADKVKVPAAWLIEQCGWKGYRRGNYGVHNHQALVLVNYGGAKGQDIYALSEEIICSVNERFGILLEREVQVL